MVGAIRSPPSALFQNPDCYGDIPVIDTAMTFLSDASWLQIIDWAVRPSMYLAGFIYALCTCRRHPVISLFVAVAMASLLAWAIYLVWRQQQPDFLERQRWMTDEDHQWELWFQGLPYCAVFFILVVLAVAGRKGRKRKSPALFQEGPSHE
jgi:hypothetical protein